MIPSAANPETGERRIGVGIGHSREDSIQSFAGQVARLHLELTRAGVPFADMRRAETLELQLAGVPDLGRAPADRLAPVEIERLEGPIVARQVPPLPRSASRLRYFLDGSQRTFPVLRIGVVPVAATIAAAAILVRDADGNPTIAPGTLRLKHAWLIPRLAADPEIHRAVRLIEDRGMAVEDPLDRLTDPADYAAAAGDYSALVEYAYARARKIRERLEVDLLGDWESDPRRATDAGWIVVDGRLRVAARRAVGVVKDLTNQHLSGAEAAMLFGLPPGHRTSAFRPHDRYRSVGIEPEASVSDTAMTLWYLRLWDAQGLDARHALVRVEAGPDVRATAGIDELSAWLLAERTPRATADTRWATLLYPVHYLERILKRRLEADTRGWPGPH